MMAVTHFRCVRSLAACHAISSQKVEAVFRHWPVLVVELQEACCQPCIAHQLCTNQAFLSDA